MPWSENAHMSRSRFVADFESCLYTMTELCESRKSAGRPGTSGLSGMGSQGAEGLKDRSRAPNHRPTQTPAEVADRLVELRRKHPTWDRGSCRLLKKHEPEQAWAAAAPSRGPQAEGLVTAPAGSSPHSRLVARALPYPILLYRVPRGESPPEGETPKRSKRGKEVMRMPSLGFDRRDAPVGRAMRPLSPGRHGRRAARLSSRPLGVQADGRGRPWAADPANQKSRIRRKT